jgi:hypothetical protein
MNTLCRGHLLPPPDEVDGFFPVTAAHLDVCFERTTHGGTFRAPKQPTQIFDRKVQTAFPGRFAIRHARDRGTDGGGYTASATAFAAIHDVSSSFGAKCVDDKG